MERIYLGFANNLPADSLCPHNPSLFQGYTAIEANARYFDRTRNPTDAVSFAPFVDQDNVLANMMTDGFYHGSENRVEYFTRVEGADHKITHVFIFLSSDNELLILVVCWPHRYRPINPALFRIGDIVEILLSFIVFPCKEAKFKMICRLRGLLLINQEERDVRKPELSIGQQIAVYAWLQKANILEMRSRYEPKIKERVSAKRKALYSDETAEEETRKRLAKMNIE